jgi:hypothetical protein
MQALALKQKAARFSFSQCWKGAFQTQPLSFIQLTPNRASPHKPILL